MCKATITPREYAWGHFHPTKGGQRVGIGLMMAGGFAATIGLLERLGRL
jgi:hypothetical protein